MTAPIINQADERNGAIAMYTRPKAMRTIDRAPRNPDASGSHSMSRDQAEPIAIRLMRQDFLAMPEHKQIEQLNRVYALLRAEATSSRRQPSALARLAPQVYGANLEDI